jgi:parallel beta-helix repeat protein
MNEVNHPTTDRRALLAGIGGLAAGTLLSAGRAEAGPLNPPGAPAPTPGPEPRIAINAINTPGDASNLFQITQPGSYYLTGNVTGQAPRRGIRIAASNVTIDLNGFEFRGVPGTAAGIITEGAFDNIVIRNGTVCDWGAEGISLAAGATDSTGVGRLIEGVMAARNSGDGIRAHVDAIVRNCTSVENTGDGIRAGVGAVVDSCVADGNLGSGIVCDGSSAISNCLGRSNSGSGISGANLAVISNCAVRGNGGLGIAGGEGSKITDCSAYDNSLSGFSMVSGTITNCVAELNRNNGFFVAFRSRISGCSTHANWFNGIQVLSNCVIEGNLFNADGLDDEGTVSGGGGVNVLSSFCRITGNTCIGCARGIYVQGVGNLVTGNACKANQLGNYDIIAGNRYGEIIDATGGGTAGASGNSAASTALTTDPWANFAY